jgi:group I intron endonuclease
MNIIGIYRIINPKGKIYIGQSTNIKKRWNVYKNLQCKGQTLLYRSLKKYGPENHVFEILEFCEIDELIRKENYYKDLYNVFYSPSLCCRYDGKGGRDSEETRLRKQVPKNLTTMQKEIKNNKISQANTGKFRTEATKIKMKNPKTDSHKNKIREALIGRKIEWNVGRPQRIINQYDLNSNFIQEWPTIVSAAQYYNINTSNIVANCNGRYKSTGGFIWKYKE